MKLEELTVGSFSELLASEAPAPGGGSTAALGGALGAALTAMICRLTVGKEAFAEHRESLLHPVVAAYGAGYTGVFAGE